MPDHMNNAKLNLRFGEHGFDSFGKTFQPVNARDEDVFDAARLQLRDHLQPQLRALGLSEPDA